MKTAIANYKNQTSLSIAIMVMAVIGVFIWMSSAGSLTDDWWYEHEFNYNSYEDALRGFENCDGAEIKSWSQVFNSVINHRQHWNNCRLANVMMFVSNMVPVWLIDVAHALMWGLMILILLRTITSKWNNRPLMTVCVMWSVWIVMPWHDQMASTDYQMNYVWTSALNLLFIHCLFASKNKYFVSFLALFSSLMHEGFSIPISVGLFVWFLSKYKERKKVELSSINKSDLNILPIIVYWAGTILVTFGPAFYNRLFDESLSRTTIDFTSFVYKFFLREPIFLITLTLTMFYYFRRGRVLFVEFIKDNIIWWSIGVLSFVMWIVLDGTERQMWIGYVAFLIINWKIVCYIWSDESNWQSLVGIALGILQLVWLITIAIFQQKANKELSEITNAINSTDAEIVYVDTYSPSWLPWWTLDIPEHYHGRNPHLRGEHYALHRQGWNDALITLPEKYKGQSFEIMPKIEGSAGFKGVFPFYYSIKKYGDEIGFARFRVVFSDVPMKEYFNRAYMLYRLPELSEKIIGESGQKEVEVDFRRVAVTTNSNDTIWFYRVHRLGQSLRGCSVVSIDTLRIE